MQHKFDTVKVVAAVCGMANLPAILTFHPEMETCSRDCNAKPSLLAKLCPTSSLYACCLFVCHATNTVKSILCVAGNQMWILLGTAHPPLPSTLYHLAASAAGIRLPYQQRLGYGVYGRDVSIKACAPNPQLNINSSFAYQMHNLCLLGIMHEAYMDTTYVLHRCCITVMLCSGASYHLSACSAVKSFLYLAMQGTIQTSRWVGAPQPRQHDAPPTPLERTTSPAVYQSLPYRTRNHRPFEPFDTALHHHSTRSTAHAPEPGRQEHGGNAVHRRSTRDTSQQGSLEVLPPPALPRRHFRRTPTSEELAERIADRRRREEARAAYNTRYELCRVVHYEQDCLRYRQVL